MRLFTTMRYKRYIFCTNRQLKWISACITSYTDLVWQSQLITCKTTTRNLSCITEFSLSICQYLVLQTSTITFLRLQSNFTFPDQDLLVPRPTYISHQNLSIIVSAVLMKNLLCSIQTKKIISVDAIAVLRIQSTTEFQRCVKSQQCLCTFFNMLPIHFSVFCTLS